MRGVDVIANVTASNAEFYRAAGHPGSVYVPNTWIDSGFAETGPRPVRRPYRIIGHAGYLNRTGSTFALKFLFAELLPELDKVMGELEFEVVIAGSGKIPTALQPYVNHKRIVLKGFVEDFDAELRTSDVFLLLNNAGRYIAAYTRHMVAWSMGLCLIAHANSKKAIPEIEHMENALIAADAKELAGLVRAALIDADLNAKIRRGGRRIFEEHFSADKVARALSGHIERLAGRN
jgi:glycosyltransferase involved in cell wall biosynthesis